MFNAIRERSRRHELPQTAVIYVGRRENGEPADYVTVQEAVDAIPAGNKTPVLMYLLPGRYREVVRVNGDKPMITMVGCGAKPEDVVITYDNYAGIKLENGEILGTFRSATVSVYADEFRAQNLTFENTYLRTLGEIHTQSVAFYASGEHMVFDNCRFVSKQDTLYTRDGSQLYRNCYIEGDVDFIFGGARAIFDHCTIFSRVRPERGPGQTQGFVTAPSTFLAQRYGYVLRDCVLESDCEPQTVYLGRPWHPGYDPTAVGCAYFVHCELGPHIIDEGWTDMSGFLARDARFGENQNSGPGAVQHPSRPQLTDAEAAELTNLKVLGWEE